MDKLSLKDLYSLEDYAINRVDFRAKVMNHKKNRRLSLGQNMTLYFEDRLTMQYQVQEMLRIERIFEKQGIEEELEAYNPLIPDGKNLKATFMIEIPDPIERREKLQKLTGIENQVWLRVNGHDPVIPFADEDLERTNDKATSAVHFLRFEMTSEMVASLKGGANLAAGVDHPVYSHRIDQVPENIRNALVKDFS